MSTTEDQFIERMRKKNEARQALLDQKLQERVNRISGRSDSENTGTSTTSSTTFPLSNDTIVRILEDDYIDSSYPNGEAWKESFLQREISINGVSISYEDLDKIFYDAIVNSFTNEYEKYIKNKQYDSVTFNRIVHFLGKEESVLAVKKADVEQQEFEKKQQEILVLWIFTILVIVLQILYLKWWALLSVILTLAIYACVHYLCFKESIIDFFKSDFLKKFFTSSNN